MNQLEYRRSIELAQDFLNRCFAPGEFIALLLRREEPVSVTQRVVLLERAIASRYLGWLAHQNAAGANIYAAANPLRSGARKRTKESVDSVRHLYMDIDSDGEAMLAALQNSDRVPKPTAIISTSPPMIPKPHVATGERTAKQSNSEHDWATATFKSS